MNEDSLEWIKTFKFTRIDRTDFVLDSWTFGEPDELVEQLAFSITEEYKLRRGLPKTHPQFVSSLKWLKPVCYNAILTCLHYELFEELETRIERYGRLRRGPDVERPFFMTGLIGIFAHDKSEVQVIGHKRELIDTLTSEKERERLAKAMWWGFRHYMSPAELNQFNRKHPLHKATAKHLRDYLVPELQEHIVLRRVWSYEFGGNIEHERGRYPDEIEQAVIACSNKKWQERAKRPKVFDPDWD